MYLNGSAVESKDRGTPNLSPCTHSRRGEGRRTVGLEEDGLGQNGPTGGLEIK